jgi:hypothetical protein
VAPISRKHQKEEKNLHEIKTPTFNEKRKEQKSKTTSKTSFFFHSPSKNFHRPTHKAAKNIFLI